MVLFSTKVFSCYAMILITSSFFIYIYIFFFLNFFIFIARLNLFIVRLSFLLSAFLSLSLFFLPLIYQRRLQPPASGQSVNRSLFTAALCARLLHPHFLIANNLSICRLTGRLHKTTSTSQSPHRLVGSQVCGCRYCRPCSRQPPCT